VAVRNWVLNPTNALADTDVDAANVAVNVTTDTNAPRRKPRTSPDVAQPRWEIHTHRNQPEQLIST
jgi:hypothetical protein